MCRCLVGSDCPFRSCSAPERTLSGSSHDDQSDAPRDSYTAVRYPDLPSLSHKRTPRSNPDTANRSPCPSFPCSPTQPISTLMSPHGAARSLPGEDTDSADSSNPNPETPHPSHPSPSGTPSTASIPPELSQSRAQSASNRRAFASSGRTKSPFSTVKGEQGGDEPACMTRSGRVGTRSSLSLRAFPGRSDPAIGYWSGCADLG